MSNETWRERFNTNFPRLHVFRCPYEGKVDIVETHATEEVVDFLQTEIEASEKRGYDTAMKEIKQAEPEILAKEFQRGVEMEREKWQEKRQCFTCDKLDKMLTREKETGGLDNWYKQLFESENKKAIELMKILKSFVDDEQCQYDHHGYCQTHCAGNPCNVAVARLKLKEYEEAGK